MWSFLIFEITCELEALSLLLIMNSESIEGAESWQLYSEGFLKTSCGFESLIVHQTCAWPDIMHSY